MVHYVCLFFLALLTIAIDFYFLDLMGRSPPERQKWDIQMPEQGELVETNEKPNSTSEMKHGSIVFVREILLLGHAVCIVLFTLGLYWKFRSYESSCQQLEEELRVAKAETVRAQQVLAKRTADQLNWLCLITESVKELEKTVKKKNTHKSTVGRDSIGLN